MVSVDRIAIEVTCAERERQTVLSLEVPVSCTAARAIALSGIFELHPELDPAGCGVGIFGREVARDHPLSAGDRVEVLRPLPEDPRERRRRLACAGKAIGGSSAGGR
jgi:putative ubiquitin-RnfH superfamily antitoxin RatB of RatAB toxin-antitoxin module